MSMHHVRCQRKNCNDYEFVWKSLLVVVVNVCKFKINVSSMNNLLSDLTTNNLRQSNKLPTPTTSLITQPTYSQTSDISNVSGR